MLQPPRLLAARLPTCTSPRPQLSSFTRLLPQSLGITHAPLFHCSRHIVPVFPITVRSALTTQRRRLRPVHPAHALHRKRARSRRIQHVQLLPPKNPGHNPYPKRDRRQQDNRKPDRRDRLRHCERRPEEEQLAGDERRDHALPQDTLQRLGGGCARQVAVPAEVHKLEDNAVGCERLGAHCEEEAGEDPLRDEVYYDEEGARHSAEGEEALREVRNALFDDARGFALEAVGLGLGGVGRVGDTVLFGYAEGSGVEGRLGDEAIGEGAAEETRDASRKAKEEDVPVEAGGFAEGEFGALRDERGDVVVEPEEDGEDECEGEGDADVVRGDVPEVDEPAATRGGEEGFACGEGHEVNGAHMADMDEASEEDDGEWGAVIFNEFTDVALE